MGYRPMRLLILADEIWGTGGGTEQHLAFLMKHLPRYEFEVHFSVIRQTDFDLKSAFPLEPYMLGLHTCYSASGIRKAVASLHGLIRQHGIDIVYAFSLDSQLLGVLAASMARPCRIVAARRNIWHERSLKDIWRARSLSRFTDRFIANCNAVKRAVAKEEWLPPERITVVHNPLNADRLKDGVQQSLSKKALFVEERSPLVGMVATFRKIKDHESFLRAAKIVRTRFPETCFIMVGETIPNRRRDLEIFAAQLDLHDRIFITGDIANPISLMRLFDVGVLSSLSEGLSNTLIEYAAVGLPIVATNVGGNSEVVQDGINGFLTPPAAPEILADRICLLLANPKLRQSLGENGKRIAALKFDQGKVLAAYQHIFCSMCGLPGPSGTERSI